jgi:hypothetical protein
MLRVVHACSGFMLRIVAKCFYAGGGPPPRIGLSAGDTADGNAVMVFQVHGVGSGAMFRVTNVGDSALLGSGHI